MLMVTKKQASSKKATPKSAAKSRASTKKRTVSAAKPATVDYYPNRMTLAVSLLAAVLLLLLGVIVSM